MKVVFISNYLNHHQLPFCEAMLKKTDGNFTFVATTPIPEFRIKLGYADMNHEYDFVICAYESDELKQKALKACAEADVAITGSAPDDYIKERLKKRKLTFRYSERIYKNGVNKLQLPIRCLKYFFKHTRHKNLYMLCASAYTAGDYARTFTFLNKTYKWGYFPQIKKYEDIDSLIKTKAPASLLWVGRLIDWKHPELPIEAAKRLQGEGVDFTLNIVGTGELEDMLKQKITEYNLTDRVFMRGSMSPEEVRTYMEKSEIFLFTSDRGEGWGAVLNEAMNSGCAVVASHAIGSAPFLISDGENGTMYCDGNFASFYSKLKELLEDPQKRALFGKNAYKTMIDDWNADSAAERLLVLVKHLNENKKGPVFSKGVCSTAEPLKDDWYK